MDIKYKLYKGMQTDFNEDASKHLFFTSDTHFFHDNIRKFCDRPFGDVEQMNAILIERWNNKVGPDDTVFHLGDFCWGGYSNWSSILSQLNGHKILVLGNHDRKNLSASIAEKYFDYIAPQLYVRIDGRMVYMNHLPFLVYDGIWRPEKDMVWQLFGHVHSKPGYTGKDGPRLQMLLPTQYDVGVDRNKFTPLSWEEVKTIINNQIANYETTRD